MRIAVNARFLLPGKLEGIGYFSREILRRLPELMPEHDFLFCFDRKFDPAMVFGKRSTGVVIHPPARDPLLWKAWFDYGIPRALSKWEADLFFSPDGYCSLKLDVPQVMVTHDIAHVHYPAQIPRRVRKYYQKHVPLFLNKADHIITVSHFVKEDIRRYYGIYPGKITVAGNGVRPAFKPVPAHVRLTTREVYADGQPYLFYLGAVHPRKNIGRLLQAYDRYRDRLDDPVKLLIAGRLAWQTREVRRLHRNSRYREDIVFLGYLPTEQIVNLLGSSRALVYPSLSEGFGVPLLEAMHCEVPILTSKATSLPEVAGDAAVYVDPESISSITEGLLQLTTTPFLASGLVEKGRRQREKFSWDRSAETVATTLLQLPNSPTLQLPN